MTSSELKHLIEIHRTTQAELAKQIPCTPDELARTISGERKNHRIRVRLAELLGLTVEKMFDAEFEAVASVRKEQVA